MQKGTARIIAYLLVTLFFIPVLTLAIPRVISSLRPGPSGLTLQTEWLSLLTLDLGLLIVFAIVLLGGMAFIHRRTLKLSLLFSRPVLMSLTLADLILQGWLLLWYSRWAAHSLSETHAADIHFVLMLTLLAALLMLVKGLFRDVPSQLVAEAETLTRDDAPVLWQRVDALAQRLEMSPPDQIIAGIDATLYLTDAPLWLEQQQVSGRTLYLSIPLLRQLSMDEADAVIAHELMLLACAGKVSGTSLPLQVRRMDCYLALLRHHALTRLVWSPLALWRALFGQAWQRRSRQWEQEADKRAATCAGPATLINALIKLTACASYRDTQPQTLFACRAKQAIDTACARSLTQYAVSPDFLTTLQRHRVPHPYHHHPTLCERMRNVGFQVKTCDFAAIAAELPPINWTVLIPMAEEIEQRLWQKHRQK